jgi:hypothetical protein
MIGEGTPLSGRSYHIQIDSNLKEVEGMKRLAVESKERLTLVDGRIAAIELELVDLKKERELLSGLIKLYEGKQYDSITEERRVTGHMLKPGTRGLPSGHHYKAELDELILTVLDNRDNALRTGEIYEKCKILSPEVGYHTVSKTLNRLLKDDKVVREGQAYFLKEDQV